jgi:hypothetical protein
MGGQNGPKAEADVPRHPRHSATAAVHARACLFACSQPRRLGAHARFHAVHARACLLLSSSSRCTGDVLVCERCVRLFRR